MPKVSVVIITYNRSKLLGTAITSVLNQTFHDFELIVVDDASQDNTAEVVRSFSDKRIRYIRHETNKREAGARNTGVQNSKCEYIAFLDDDDEWLPAKLQRQVDLLDSSPAAVGSVYTGFLKIDSVTGKTLDQIVPTKRGNIFQDMLVENWVGTPSTVLIRNECLKKAGLFDEGIAFGPDYDMWIRISKEFQFEYIGEPLVYYSVHQNNLSTDKALMIKGQQARLRKYSELFATNSKSYSEWYRRLGVLYCCNGEMAEGREALLKAIRIYPFQIRPYFGLLLSLLTPENFNKAMGFKEIIVDSFNKPHRG